MFRAILVLGVLGVVMFMAGWFTVDRNSEETTIRFDRDEIRADTAKAIAKGRDFLEKTRQNNTSTAQDQQGIAPNQGQPGYSNAQYQTGGQNYGTQQYGTQQYGTQQYGTQQYPQQPQAPQQSYQQAGYQNYKPPVGYQPSNGPYVPQQANRQNGAWNQPPQPRQQF